MVGSTRRLANSTRRLNSSDRGRAELARVEWEPTTVSWTSGLSRGRGPHCRHQLQLLFWTCLSYPVVMIVFGPDVAANMDRDRQLTPRRPSSTSSRLPSGPPRTVFAPSSLPCLLSGTHERARQVHIQRDKTMTFKAKPLATYYAGDLEVS
jgi:hypothetical protein